MTTDTGRSNGREIRVRNKILALPVSPTSPALSTSVPKRVRISGADIRSPAAACSSSMLGGGGGCGAALPFAFAFFAACSAADFFVSVFREARQKLGLTQGSAPQIEQVLMMTRSIDGGAHGRQRRPAGSSWGEDRAQACAKPMSSV